jgi:hypothetical protein
MVVAGESVAVLDWKKDVVVQNLFVQSYAALPLSAVFVLLSFF